MYTFGQLKLSFWTTYPIFQAYNWWLPQQHHRNSPAHFRRTDFPNSTHNFHRVWRLSLDILALSFPPWCQLKVIIRLTLIKVFWVWVKSSEVSSLLCFLAFPFSRLVAVLVGHCHKHPTEERIINISIYISALSYVTFLLKWLGLSVRGFNLVKWTKLIYFLQYNFYMDEDNRVCMYLVTVY